MTSEAASGVVSRFADALDRDDFAGAAELLEENCVYRTPAKELVGREAAIASFAEASGWAHKHLEKVTYRHASAGRNIDHHSVRFIDDFEHREKTIVHECLMHLTIGRGGLISELVLEELPGERERVQAFLTQIGIER